MESFNPDQSLLPSVGGNITPMSGGGQEGGLRDAQGTISVFGLNETDFKKTDNEQVLKAIAPNEIGNMSINEYWEKKAGSAETSVDEALKQDVLNTILKNPDYIKNLKFLIDSDPPLKDEDMPSIIQLLKTSIDLKNVTITLSDTELKVVIKIPSSATPTPPTPTPPTSTPPTPTPPSASTARVFDALREPERQELWNKILANKNLTDITSTHLTSFLDAVKPLFIDPTKKKAIILSQIDALDYTPHMKKAEPTATETVVAQFNGQSKRVLKEVIKEVLDTSSVV